MKYRLHAQRLFDGHSYSDNQVLTIDDGKIVAIDQDISQADVAVHGILVPGFIDLQVNGGGGVLFNSSPSVDGLKKIVAAHAQYGTTAMTPTLITDTVEVMSTAADAVAQAIAQNTPGIIGIHFEGPHLSQQKKGTHASEYIRPISALEWQVLSRQDIGQVIVTLAPETVSCQDITKMVNLGIKVCIGHTNADFATAQQAVAAGADGVTHLFNAMSPLQGREPGVVGCALLNDNTYCGLILDCLHVDIHSCQLALKAKPQGKIFLVTDAMPPVGTNETEFDFFDRKVTLNKGELRSTTGELAGSVLDMATAVKNAHQKLKLSFDEAVKMASVYPANYINQSKLLGSLTRGAQADMVLLDDDLNVKATWIKGQKIYTSEPQ